MVLGLKGEIEKWQVLCTCNIESVAWSLAPLSQLRGVPVFNANFLLAFPGPINHPGTTGK